MAFSLLYPTDNGLLISAPAQIRANWAALALLTDPTLQITNAKIAADAAISDSKLATITTAGKVSGTAITALTSVPSGAGNLPMVNLGNAWRSGDIRYTTNTNVQSLWTDISSIYNSFYVRVGSGVPLATGGADTHLHTAGSYVVPTHYHSLPIAASVSSDGYLQFDNTQVTGSVFNQYGYTGFGGLNSPSPSVNQLKSGLAAETAITGNSGVGSSTPLYVDLRMHKKD